MGRWLQGSGYKAMSDSTNIIQPARPPRVADKSKAQLAKPPLAAATTAYARKGDSNVRMDPLLKPIRKELNPKPESESITIDETELETYPIVKPKPVKPKRTEIQTILPKNTTIPPPPSSSTIVSESETSFKPPEKHAGKNNQYTLLSDTDTTDTKDYDNVLDSLGLTRDDFKVSIEGLVNRYY